MCNILKQHYLIYWHILTAPSDFFFAEPSRHKIKANQFFGHSCSPVHCYSDRRNVWCDTKTGVEGMGRPTMTASFSKRFGSDRAMELLATGCTWLLTACEARATRCEVPSDLVLGTNLLEEHQIVGHTIQGTLKAYGGASKDGVPLSLQLQDLPW